MEDQYPDQDKDKALDFANYFVSYGERTVALLIRTAAAHSSLRVKPCSGVSAVLRRDDQSCVLGDSVHLPPEGHASGPWAHGCLPERGHAQPWLL